MLGQLDAADTAELDLKLRIVSEAGERLIAHAYEQPTREDRDRVIAEMKRIWPATSSLPSQVALAGDEAAGSRRAERFALDWWTGRQASPAPRGETD